MSCCSGPGSSAGADFGHGLGKIGKRPPRPAPAPILAHRAGLRRQQDVRDEAQGVGGAGAEVRVEVALGIARHGGIGVAAGVAHPVPRAHTRRPRNRRRRAHGTGIVAMPTSSISSGTGQDRSDAYLTDVGQHRANLTEVAPRWPIPGRCRRRLGRVCPDRTETAPTRATCRRTWHSLARVRPSWAASPGSGPIFALARIRQFHRQRPNLRRDTGRIAPGCGHF